MDRRWLSAALLMLAFFGAAYFPGWKGTACLVLVPVFGLATIVFVLNQYMAGVSRAAPMLMPSAQELAAMKQGELAAAEQAKHARAAANPEGAVVEAAAAASPPTPPPPPKPAAPPKPLTGRAVFDLGEDKDKPTR